MFVSDFVVVVVVGRNAPPPTEGIDNISVTERPSMTQLITKTRKPGQLSMTSRSSITAVERPPTNQRGGNDYENETKRKLIKSKKK